LAGGGWVATPIDFKIEGFARLANGGRGGWRRELPLALVRMGVPVGYIRDAFTVVVVVEACAGGLGPGGRS